LAAEDERKKTKEKYNRFVKKYFTLKWVLIAVILLILVMMFSKAIKGVLLLILFFPLAKYSVKATAFVPHVTLEQYTSSTLLIAYMYGPFAGALSGLVLGLYGYLSNSISKFLAIVNVFIAAFVGFLIGYLNQSKIMNFPFYTTFVIGILVFNAIAYIVFLYVDSDQIQNVSYRLSHVFFNGLISVLFFNLLYNFFILF
jgi:hypothetical protein